MVILLVQAIFFEEITADWLIFGSLAGIVGGVQTMFMGAYNCISDVSSGENDTLPRRS